MRGPTGAQTSNDLVLHLEEVGHWFVEALRSQVIALSVSAS
jgi:hypothetical protein